MVLQGSVAARFLGYAKSAKIAQKTLKNTKIQP
jgi:hypothetical protein